MIKKYWQFWCYIAMIGLIAAQNGIKGRISVFLHYARQFRGRNCYDRRCEGLFNGPTILPPSLD